ncbi:MAG: glycosyltransferase family 2 protein [Bacteroidaceae bacterium]|nr:glycosyltransferase family 2 protein [Bacteroidaceae bacterium]
MEAKISVVINTYNAERQLAEVLESVRSFDEVLICDMESTDSTLDIARDFGCRIISFPRGKHRIVEPAREFAIHEAKYDWVLVADADELVTPELRAFLYDYIQRSDAADALFIPRKNYFMGQWMHCIYPDPILRFMRQSKTRWPEYVHAIPVVDGRVDRIPPRRTELAFIHIANDPVRAIVSKMNDYTDNEVQKRAHKNYGLGALFYRPFFRFFKAYIIKGGFRDGRAGFIRALLDGCYQVVMLAKITEAKRKGEIEEK